MPFSLDIPQNQPNRGHSLRKRFPVLLPLLVFLILLIGYAILNRSVSPPLIGVVSIDGIILDSESVVKKIRELEKNPQVQGIVLRINSPGGAAAPSQEIFSELKRVNQHKTVYASIASVAASGGYYVAIGAEKIYANPGSLTGSIGVIMQTFNVEQLMNRLGVQVETIKSGKNKDIGSAFRSMSDSERKLLETVLEDTHGQFIAAVQKRRLMDSAALSNLVDGRFFTGKQALQYGLIDGLASFRGTVDHLKKTLDLTDDTALYYPLDRKETLLNMFEIDSLLPIKKTFTYTGLFFLGSNIAF